MIDRLLIAADRRRGTVADGGDSGFALIYTLLVISVITILVGSVLVVTSGALIPSVQSAYSQAANTAAQSGLQAFLARVDTQCQNSNSNVQTCSIGTGQDPAATTIFAASGYSATYRLSVAKGTNSYRVTSTGTVRRGGLSATKVLVADVTGGASADVLDYNVVTGFETQSPDIVQTSFPQRNIELDAGAVTAADLVTKSGSTVVSWPGAMSTSGVANCNALFYGNGGRSQNVPIGSSTPYVDWQETTTAGAGSGNVTEYQPCQVSLGSQTELRSAANGLGGYASHDALLLSNSYPGGSGPLLDQRVSTGYQGTGASSCEKSGRDYRSYDLTCAGYPVNIGGGPRSGSTAVPTYNTTIPAVPTSAPSVASGACVYTGPTRVLLTSGGAIITSPLTTTAPTTSPSGCYPSSLTNGIRAFTIPDLTAVTHAGSTPAFNGIFSVTKAGALPATVPSPHSATGWNLVNTQTAISSTNSVFYAQGTTPTAATGVTDAEANDSGCTSTTGYTVPAASRAATACDWSNVGKVDTAAGGWTTLAGGLCNSAPAATARLSFECAYSQQTNAAAPARTYSTLRTCVKNDLAYGAQTGSTPATKVTASCLASPVDCATTSPSAATTAVLQCLLDRELSRANTGSAYYGSVSAPAGSPTTGAVRYVVSAVQSQTGVAGGTNVATPVRPFASDPLFANTTGTNSSTSQTYTTSTYTVSRQVYRCYGVLLLGACLLNVGGPLLGLQWGNDSTAGTGTPQFTTSITQSTWSAPTAGTAVTSTFPTAGDTGSYAVGTLTGSPTSNTGPGDLYVEGTASRTIGLVADNDVVVTGNLTESDTAKALAVVSQGNVRIYHPVACHYTTTSATTQGFCADDITGLYSGVAAANYRGDKVYDNLRNDLSSITVNAAVFALGGAARTTACPQPASGPAGVCGGQFGVDNYNRGAQLGSLTITGTLVMQHHGPVGQEWEIADSTGQSGRPYSGYQLILNYQNLKAGIADTTTADTRVKDIVTTTSTTSSLWHIVSVSTGRAS